MLGFAQGASSGGQMAGRHRRQRHATAGLRDVLTASTCTPALGGRHHTLGKAAPASARLPWLLRPSGSRTTLISQRSHPSMLHHHGSPPPRTTTSRLIEAKPSCAIARSPFPSRLVCTMRILVSFEVCQVALLPPHPTLHTLDPLSELSTIHTLLGLTTTPLTNPPSEEPRGASHERLRATTSIDHNGS